MKLVNYNGLLAVGTAEEILPVVKSMRRAWREDRSNIFPSHGNLPLLKAGRMYGISIEQGEYHPTYYVENSDNALRVLFDMPTA